MDPHDQFWHNPDCSDRGQSGLGNIRIHSRKEQRYCCSTCRRTFAATRGTPFYRLRTATDVVTLVLTLLCHGCPLQAIVAAFGFDERTVAQWQARAGEHCQEVHRHLVEQGQVELGQVQADELWVKLVGKRLWMAMALAVPSRLWLGGVISPHRRPGLDHGVGSEGPCVCTEPRYPGLRRWLGGLRHCLFAGIPLSCAYRASRTT
jgi:transposase-like protein